MAGTMMRDPMTIRVLSYTLAYAHGGPSPDLIARVYVASRYQFLGMKVRL